MSDFHPSRTSSVSFYQLLCILAAASNKMWSMLDLKEIQNIRDMYYRQKMSIKEICDETSKDYRTVRKYLDMNDFNEPLLMKNERPSKLDPWKATIVQWLTADISMPPKQRHTGWRVYDRLTKEFEGFNCSYETVNRFVRNKRNEMKLDRRKPMIPLDHSVPGIGQGDFGAVRFAENGVLHNGHEFVISFPHSTAMFSVLSYGENTECLLESLDTIFRYIGGVPPEIWFDNASSMVKTVIQGQGRVLQDKFERFCLHYRLKPIFMNRSAGNEKGSGENAVGTLRRNLYVPLPEFDDLFLYNQLTLERCAERIQSKKHYISQVDVSELFEEDRAALLPLPRNPFDLSTSRSFITDETGLFVTDKGYRYSTTPEMALKSVNVKFTATEVIILGDDRHTEIVKHRRLYGEETRRSIQWGPYLRAMSYKPRSFLNTEFKDLLPDELALYIAMTSNHDRGLILSVMADVYESKDFEAVKTLCLKAAVVKAFDPDSFKRLSVRMYGSQSEKQMVQYSWDDDLNKLDKVLTASVRKKEKT